MRPKLFEQETREEIEAKRLAACEPLDTSRRVTGRAVVSSLLDAEAAPIPKRPRQYFYLFFIILFFENFF